ncbi:MAG: hypothetical protein Kow0069_21950 [Promethearchaeota archaeon]
MSEGNGGEVHHVVATVGLNDEANHFVASYFGKPGTSSDLAFYNRLEEGKRVWVVVRPLGYPDKLRPAVQALRLAKAHVLVAHLPAGVTPALGELVVTLDEFHQRFQSRVFACVTGVDVKNEYALPEFQEKLAALFRETSFGGKSVSVHAVRAPNDREQLRRAIESTPASPETGLGERRVDETKVLVDHAFPVKGVGTVVLGIAERGRVQAGSMLELVGPSGKKKVIVRSIQKHDRDFKVAEAGDRVGLALKGVRPEDVGRDHVLASSGTIDPVNRVELADFHLHRYFQEEVSPESGRQYHILVNLATSPVKLVEGRASPGDVATLRLLSEKALPVDTEGTPATLLALGRFEGRLRVLGSGVARPA